MDFSFRTFIEAVNIDPKTGSRVNWEQTWKRIVNTYNDKSFYGSFREPVGNQSKNPHQGAADGIFHGINWNSRYSETPAGIYTYPMTHIIGKDLINARIGAFAKRKPQLHIYKLSDPSQIMFIADGDKTTNAKKYCESKGLDYAHMVDKLSKNMTMFKMSGSKSFESLTPNGIVYFLAGMLASESSTLKPKKWSSVLAGMNILGVDDRGTSTIHSAEPTQAIFFSTKMIPLVETVFNQPAAWGQTNRTKTEHITIKIGDLVRNLTRSVQQSPNSIPTHKSLLKKTLRQIGGALSAVPPSEKLPQDVGTDLKWMGKFVNQVGDPQDKALWKQYAGRYRRSWWPF